jgi:hypothetical protein
VALATAVLLSAGCAGNDATGGGDPDQVRAQMEDLLRDQYAQWYAGTVLDGDTVIVYRKPGSELDRRIPERFDIKVRFADAKLSETEMRTITDRIVADTAFWSTEGIKVNGAGPLPDGSAVRVMTPDGKPGEADRMSRHYGKPIVVERGAAEFAPFSMDPGGSSPPGTAGG